MKVYVVISSYQHGLGEAVEVDAEVFSTIDKARKAIRHKGMNTLENYKRVLNCDDYLYNITLIAIPSFAYLVKKVFNN